MRRHPAATTALGPLSAVGPLVPLMPLVAVMALVALATLAGCSSGTATPAAASSSTVVTSSTASATPSTATSATTATTTASTASTTSGTPGGTPAAGAYPAAEACAYLTGQLPALKAITTPVGREANLAANLFGFFQDNLIPPDGAAFDAAVMAQCPAVRTEVLTLVGLDTFASL